MKKQIISICLILAIVIGCVTPFLNGTTVKADDNSVEYREYTFADWGYSSGTITGTTSGNFSHHWSLATPITSWDKVAVNGKITFSSGNTGSTMIVFGANKTSGSYAGIKLVCSGSEGFVQLDGFGITAKTAEGAGNVRVYNVNLGVANDFRVTFLKQDDGNYKVGFSFAGSAEQYLYVSETEMGSLACDIGIGLWEYESLGLESKMPEVEYMDYTFSDWGLSNQVMTGQTSGNYTTNWSASQPITSWNKVAVSGKVTFGETTTGNTMIIFGANKTHGAWSGLKMIYAEKEGFVQVDGNGFVTSPARVQNIERGKTYDFRLTFLKKNAENYQVGFAMGDSAVQYITVPCTTMDGLAFDVLCAVWGNETVYVESKEADIEWKDYTFEDWGYANQTITSASNGWSTARPITSWNKVAFNGKFVFSETATGNSCIIFGTEFGEWVGLKLLYHAPENLIQLDGNGINIGSIRFNNINAGEAVNLRMTFLERSGGNYRVGLSVNGSKEEYLTVSKEAMASIGNNILINMAAGESYDISSNWIFRTYYEAIDTYRSGNSMTAPTKAGYVFAGWQDAEGDTLTPETKAGAAYAKWVPKDVLSVKVQLPAGATLTDAKTQMRLVTTVDSTAYAKVGFEVRTEYGALDPIEIQKVYKQINARNATQEFNYSPDVFHSYSEYFATVILSDIRVSEYPDLDYTIKPYWITQDGTRVYGATRTVTIREIVESLQA